MTPRKPLIAALTFLAAACTPAVAQDGQSRGAQPDQPPKAAQPDARPDAPKVEPCQEAPADMACIPGGWFVRGSEDGHAQAKPRQKVWVQTFFMERHEVTVAEYEECVANGKCDEAKTNYWGFSRPRQPKNGISWFDAKQYCQAQGRRLPTEAEWEHAARGFDGRSYPWGEERATCELAVIKDSRGRSCGVRKRRGKHKVGRTFVVGSRPPNQYGLYDMAGNSWEWVQDWGSDSYAECGEACAGIAPKGPCDGKAPCKGHYRRVVRGGSWYWPAPYSRTFHRRFHFPKNDPYHHFGWRCAASLDGN